MLSLLCGFKELRWRYLVYFMLMGIHGTEAEEAPPRWCKSLCSAPLPPLTPGLLGRAVCGVSWKGDSRTSCISGMGLRPPWGGSNKRGSSCGSS